MKTYMTPEDKMRLMRGLLDALTHHHSDDIGDFIDLLDPEIVPKEGTDDTFILTVSKFVDEVAPGTRFNRSLVGMITVKLEVKVTDSFQKCDEDE